MSSSTSTYAAWQRLSGRPGGSRLFSVAAMARVPYFASVLPHVVRMEPGLAEVRVPKWFFVKGVELLPPHSYEAPFAHAHAVRSQTGPTLRSATVYTEPDCVTLLPRRVKVMVVGTTT